MPRGLSRWPWPCSPPRIGRRAPRAAGLLPGGGASGSRLWLLAAEPGQAGNPREAEPSTLRLVRAGGHFGVTPVRKPAPGPTIAFLPASWPVPPANAGPHGRGSTDLQGISLCSNPAGPPATGHGPRPTPQAHRRGCARGSALPRPRPGPHRPTASRNGCVLTAVFQALTLGQNGQWNPPGLLAVATP